MEKTVLVDIEKGVALVTLHRPRALNALDESMLNELEAEVHKLSAMSDLRAIILTGSGEKAFVAGADIKAMAELAPAAAERFSALGHRVIAALEALPAPVIA